ncbi:MAG: hypothetical protein ACI4NF_06105 [Christensenellales bacterium]
MSRGVKTSLIICAAVILAAVIIWNVSLNATGELTRLVKLLERYGYAVSTDELYPSGSADNTTAAELFASEANDGKSDAEILDAAADASREAGFSADVNRRGNIVVMLCAVSDEEVITLIIIDGDVEFAFIQVAGTDEVRVLGHDRKPRTAGSGT